MSLSDHNGGYLYIEIDGRELVREALEALELHHPDSRATEHTRIVFGLIERLEAVIDRPNALSAVWRGVSRDLSNNVRALDAAAADAVAAYELEPLELGAPTFNDAAAHLGTAAAAVEAATAALRSIAGDLEGGP